MRVLMFLLLALITLSGWAAGLLILLIGSGALHEIQGAIYFLTGTVAFCAGAIIGELQPRQ